MLETAPPWCIAWFGPANTCRQVACDWPFDVCFGRTPYHAPTAGLLSKPSNQLFPRAFAELVANERVETRWIGDDDGRVFASIPSIEVSGVFRHNQTNPVSGSLITDFSENGALELPQFTLGDVDQYLGARRRSPVCKRLIHSRDIEALIVLHLKGSHFKVPARHIGISRHGQQRDIRMGPDPVSTPSPLRRAFHQYLVEWLLLCPTRTKDLDHWKVQGQFPVESRTGHART